MSSSLESTPPGSLSTENLLQHLEHGGAAERKQRSTGGRRRKGLRSIEVTPYTTYYTSTPANQLHRHAAMSLLLKTSEGRERTLRFVQNMLRLYVFLNSKHDRNSHIATHSRAALRPAPRRTTRLLLLVFFLSAFRKFRNLCELLAPFAPSGTNSRLRLLAGTSDLATSTSTWKSSLSHTPSRTTGAYSSDNTSSSRWLWTEKHAWAGGDPKEDGIRAAMPPVSDEQSLLLRQRLEGLEVTLSLLDTISDGVALFAKLGVTLSLPLKLIQNRLQKHINRTKAVLLPNGRTRGVFERLSTRAELLADVFWLSTTLVSLAHSEWERREVWKYGRRVRRLMREEEIERDRTERELEMSMNDSRAGYGDDESFDEGADEEQRILENERRVQRIRDQRRTLRDLRGRLTWLWWDRLRLGADAVFALYDLFEWRPGSEAVRAVAGAISAGVGFSQIWSESSRHAKLAPRSRRPSVSA